MAPGARGARIEAKRERRVREGRGPVSDPSFLLFRPNTTYCSILPSLPSWS
jgi:hypothetical protein